MAGQIEKLTRMRKNILWGFLIGTVIAFCILIYPFVYTFNIYLHGGGQYYFGLKHTLFYLSVYIWFLTLLISLFRYWLYKKKLRIDPSLRMAVYDERVKTNWLKSYRFAFFIAIGLTVFWKSHSFTFTGSLMNPRFIMPNGPFLVLWGAVISLIGAFLFFNREAKND